MRSVGPASLPLLLLALVPSSAAPQDSSRSRPSVELPAVQVIGRPHALARIPGSGQIVDALTLTGSHPRDLNEALRKVPGLFARDEEGFGLRPNLGIRGLNPTRSTKVLLLEDGIPFTIAPYGDNASYYHPPLDRFERIEVLKGSGQILFGPQTIGGVINYITPAMPATLGATATFSLGARGFLDGHASAGGMLGRVGLLFDYGHKAGRGARENVGSRLDDVSARALLRLGASQTLTWRANYYRERSRVTYSGLTESEYATAPRQNPFRNDSMRLDRWGVSATHQVAAGQTTALTTTVYGYRVARDWWRQSSSSTQRPNDASDPTCDGMANIDTTCGNEGRLRDYTVWGVEPRLRLDYRLGSLPVGADLGVRAHFEEQERRQVNGTSPNARTAGPASDPNAGLKEDNRRVTDAFSAFLQQRFFLGRFGLTPGARIEHVRYRRTNRLAGPGSTGGVTGRTSLTALIPGMGLTYLTDAGTTLFAGAHRGFAPPRTEDVINNTTGATVDLDPELSWNYELGVRSAPRPELSFEATLFRMDFDNQVIAASLAGGSGAALTSAGRTRHAGLEVAARLAGGMVGPGLRNLYFRTAYTWLGVARFEGDRFAYLGTAVNDVGGKEYAGPDVGDTRERLRVTGNRLPYAPEHLLTGTLGYAHPGGVDFQLEAVSVSRAFGDAANTTVLVPDGQQGPIPGSTVWNAAVTVDIRPLSNSVFLSVKNLFDHRYIVDRSRGILPGNPRTLLVGLTYRIGR